MDALAASNCSLDATRRGAGGAACQSLAKDAIAALGCSADVATAAETAVDKAANKTRRAANTTVQHATHINCDGLKKLVADAAAVRDHHRILLCNAGMSSG